VADRIYLIGTGHIAASHVEAAGRLEQPFSEVHAADANPAALSSFCQQFPAVRPHRTVEDLLSSPANEADVVVVATPPASHAALSIQALSSGRHVLCEKPLAMTMEEARRMLEAARSAGRHLGCCSTRFIDTVCAKELRDLLQRGELGPLYHVRWQVRLARSRTGIDYQPGTPWFVDRARSGGGVLMDWSPYDMTLLNDILRPSRVDVRHAWMATPQTHLDQPPPVLDVEFHVGAAMVYHVGEHRVPVTFERASCTHGTPGTLCEFECERGAARLEWLAFGKPDRLIVVRDQQGKPVTEERAYPVYRPMDNPLHLFTRLVRGGTGREDLRTRVADDRMVFNFGCLQLIYETAASGAATSLSLDDLR